MVSSRMEPNTSRTMLTNATIEDNSSSTKSGGIESEIRSYEVVLRGYKTIWIPDLSNPQNITVKILLYSIGGPVSDIYISDYLPQGATIWGLNITLYNHTSGQVVDLINGSDYYLGDPTQTTLPDGTYVDVYYYNFSYNFTHWDGNLNDTDWINITYNATVLGGGSWSLPAIIAGFDPTYKKHIKTEMYESVNIPSFDVILEMLTDVVKPGEVVKALLRIINVGGPRAKVDVFVEYSVKTVDGELINEKSETIAVVESKEKKLEILLPEDMKPGIYIFESFVSYVGREALSTGTFRVEAEEAGHGDYTIHILFLGILLIMLGMYYRTTKMLKMEISKTGTSKRTSMVTILLILLILLTLLQVNPEIHNRMTNSVSHKNLYPDSENTTPWKFCFSHNHRFTRCNVFQEKGGKPWHMKNS